MKGEDWEFEMWVSYSDLVSSHLTLWPLGGIAYVREQSWKSETQQLVPSYFEQNWEGIYEKIMTLWNEYEYKRIESIRVSYYHQPSAKKCFCPKGNFLSSAKHTKLCFK